MPPLKENIITSKQRITIEMAGAKYCKLDASQGVWQVKPHEDSTKYYPFNTLYGRYSCQRMPFGICSAPSALLQVFHRTMEHIMEVVEVLQKIKKHGIMLNRAKCQFGRNHFSGRQAVPIQNLTSARWKLYWRCLGLKISKVCWECWEWSISLESSYQLYQQKHRV